MILFSEWISCTIITGGRNLNPNSKIEVLIGDLKSKKLPDLPQNIELPSMVLHFGTILVFGGWKNNKTCLQLDGGTWKDHSTLNEARYWHSTVTTQRATFIFGGAYSATTYEYLPQDSTTWIKGKKDIPGGFRLGAAIAINSEQEIWLIGCFKTGKRILSFNVNDHTFQELPSLLSVKRIEHKCAFIPNSNKGMITGGYNSFEASTQIP